LPFFVRNYSLYYRKSNDFSTTPDLIYGDGDGTINKRSLEGCMHWMTHQNENISTKAIAYADHSSILGNAEAVKYIVNVLS
jgi:lysophospholipase III